MKFEKAIFLGSGDYSRQRCAMLHDVVEDALETMSGLQQPTMSTDFPRPPEEREETKRQLIEQLQNICRAFGYEVHELCFEEIP